MQVITDFMHKNMTLDDLIEQLTEIRKSSGNLDVVIPVEFECEGELLRTYGFPKEVCFNKEENIVEIELKNYFEV